MFLREGSTSPALAGNDDRPCQNTSVLNVLNIADSRCEPGALPPAVCAAPWQRAPAAHAGKGWGTVQLQKASLEKVSVGSAELNAALVGGAGVALARGRGVRVGRGCPTRGCSPGLGESSLLREGVALSCAALHPAAGCRAELEGTPHVRADCSTGPAGLQLSTRDSPACSPRLSTAAACLPREHVRLPFAAHTHTSSCLEAAAPKCCHCESWHQAKAPSPGSLMSPLGCTHSQPWLQRGQRSPPQRAAAFHTTALWGGTHFPLSPSQRGPASSAKCVCSALGSQHPEEGFPGGRAEQHWSGFLGNGDKNGHDEGCEHSVLSPRSVLGRSSPSIAIHAAQVTPSNLWDGDTCTWSSAASCEVGVAMEGSGCSPQCCHEGH